MAHNRFDWFGFVLHASLGAVIGAGVGLVCWGRSTWARSESMLPGLIMIGGGAVLGGLLAGLGKDEFWKEFGPALYYSRIMAIVIFVLVLAVLLVYAVIKGW